MMTAGGAEATAAAAAAAGGAEGAATTAAPPKPAVLPHHEDSIDLLGTAGAPVLQRAIPVAIGLLVVVGVIVWIARRR
jgi:hypothetical protein